MLAWLALTGAGGAKAGDRTPGAPTPDARPALTASGFSIRLPQIRGDQEGAQTYELDIEPVTQAARARLGGLSGRLRLSIDCDRSLFRAERLVVYSGPEQAGVAEDVRLPSEWVRGVRGTYLPALGERLCRPRPAAAPAEAPRFAVVRPTTARATAQLGSFKSRDAAEREWARLTAHDPATRRRPHRIEAAWVGDEIAYRLLVAIGQAEEADDFCRRARAFKQSCLVRRSVRSSDPQP